MRLFQALVFAVLVGAGCGSNAQALPSPTTPPTPTPSPTKAPFEVQLATIDENRGGPRMTDTVVRNIRAQMDRVLARCVMADQEVADLTVQAQNVLRDRSVNERIAAILSGWNDVLVTRSAAQGGKWTQKECMDTLTGWVFIRAGQR